MEVGRLGWNCWRCWSNDLNNNELECSDKYPPLNSICYSWKWTSARKSLNAIFIFLSSPDNQIDKLKSSICPRMDTMVLRHIDKYSSLIHNYQYFTLNRCFDVSVPSTDHPVMSTWIIYKNACLSIHLRLKKQFSWNFYNLVLMLLVRVSVPFGEHQDSGCVYIGPTLKYSSPILSLDLSKNTGNGCCFPARLDTRWTFIQTEAYKSAQYIYCVL